MRFRTDARSTAGFTLLELMIVVTILAIIATIGVPQYVSALRIARVRKAKQELLTIANAIDGYRANYGMLPQTLYQVGFGGRCDPWGHQYCYFNYTDGTGDGLEWAVAVGLVDPSALLITDQAGGGGDGGDGSTVTSPQGPSMAIGQQPTVTSTQTSSTATTQTTASSTASKRTQIGALIGSLSRDLSVSERSQITSSLGNLPRFSVYVGVPVEQTRRRDGYMFPLNSDYDLFSLGPNGSTAISLGHVLAQDDVIRANDGAYFGPASEY